MIKSPGIALYNQDRFSDEEFVANFVARNDLVEVLLASLRQIASGGANEHQMLVGTRGMGKTSLLRRIAIAVGQDADLKAHFIPLRFREEQYNILSLDAFWRNCGESLAEYCEQTGNQPLADRLDVAIETPEWRDHEKARDAFLAACAEAGGRAILLLDNLDLILNGIKEEGCWQLRATLQAAGGPIVIGAATQLLTQAADRDAAFYEFFHPHMLEPLSERELLACLNALADLRGDAGLPVKTVLAREPGRIKALFVLTGGNPRILGLIYRLFEQTGSDEIFADLEALLDQVTPFYKARIEEYSSTLQRAVIDGIALNWDPITSAALAKETGIEATTLSGQLNRLRKEGLIEEVETSGTRSGYQLAERFLNIWYLMRHGTRKTKQRLRWFTAFLSELFSAEELKQMVSDARSGRSHRWHPDHCEAIEAAVELILQRESVTKSISSAGDEADIAFQTAVDLFNAGQWQDALQIWDRIIEEGRQWATDDERLILALALFCKGLTLGELGQSGEEIAVYDEVIARFGDSDLPALQEYVAKALVQKSAELRQSGQSEAAISVYDEVVARFGDSNLPALQEQVASALVNKGRALGQLGQSIDAILLYDQIIARFGDSDLPALQEQVASALVNKGGTLGEVGQNLEAIAVFDQIIARFGDSDLTGLQGQLAKSIVGKGIAFGRLGHSLEAIPLFDDVITRFGDSDQPWLQNWVAMAIAGKGLAFGELGQSAEAIAAYDDVVARFGDSVLPALQEQVARALFNKGATLDELGQSVEAIAIYDDVIARFGGSDLPALQERVAKALSNKGGTLGELGQSVEAIAVYDDVIARFSDSGLPALQQLVARAWDRKGCLLFWELDRRTDGLDALLKVAESYPDYVAAKANLLWMYLATSEIDKTKLLLTHLGSIDANGRALMEAGINLVADNLASSLAHLSIALEKGLSGGTDYTEDFIWYLRIAAERGHGERLIAWFNETGFADRYAPIYGAYVAHARGERFLLDLNPEVRGVALPFYRKLTPGRGDPGLRREDAGGQPPRKRGRSKR